MQNYEVKTKVRVIEDEVRDFYKKNTKLFMTPKALTLRQILLKVDEKNTEQTVKEQAEKIYLQLQSGADFCELAMKYSDDPSKED